ncbi:MAG: hypothetical protein K2K90_01215 [Lachnospiraceae bacterium]|nr:hypothetical protein [Lachnospiraceae bacterium]
MKNSKKQAYIRKKGIYISLAENRRLLLCAFAWGIPFTASCVLGWRLVHEGTVFGPGGSAAAYAGSLLLFLLETAAFSVPAAAFAAVVMRGGNKRRLCPGGSAAGKTEETGSAETAAVENSQRRSVRQVWLLYSLLIFLCWMPVFLAYYPSVFAYDAEGQLYQVLAGDYSTHHPLLHTLFLGAFFRLGMALGSCSAGMAVHSVVQMALMACVFGWALSFLYQRRVPGWARVVLFLFFALFPANSVLAISTTKDVLFAALVLLYTLCLHRMVCVQDMQSGVKTQAAYIVLGVLMLLFRNNAVYAFVVSVPVVCIGLGRGKHCLENGEQGEKGGSGDGFPGERSEDRVRAGKRHVWGGSPPRRTYLHITLMIFVLYGICAFSLKAVTRAQNGSPREMLSVPLQQMARTRVEAEEKIDLSLRQELEKYIPAEWVFAAYNPHLADPVKNRAVIHDDPAGLVKTWIRLGLEHPAIYIDAFLDNSLGLWYLWDTSHAQVYGIGAESGFGYLSTDNRVMPAGFEVEEHSLLPGLRAFMERIVSDNAYSKLPAVRLLFAPALYWWLLCLYFVTAFCRKRYRETLPVVFLGAYCLTLLLSPTVLVRYIYPLMVTIPVILPCLMVDIESVESENRQ